MTDGAAYAHVAPQRLDSNFTANPGFASRRVAFFSDAESERNGAGSYYSDLIAQLGPKLADVAIFQPDSQRRRLGRLSLPLPGDPTQRLLTPNLPKLWTRVQRMRPDVIVSVTPGPFGMLGLAMAQYLGCGFVTAFHTEFEALSRLYWNPLSRVLANGYLTATNHLLCRNSDEVLVHSAGLVPTVHTLGASSVRVMGTPLPARFIDTPATTDARALRQLVFAGRLAPEKNVEAIVAAARALPELRFVIAGDGPLRRQLARDTADLDNFHMTGWLDREALRRLLDDSDLLLLPSRLETFGSIALEAMARGRPAVVAENAGIHSWHGLRDGLVPLRAGEVLADTIRRLQAQCPEARRARALRARDAARTLNDETLAQWLGLVADCRR